MLKGNQTTKAAVLLLAPLQTNQPGSPKTNKRVHIVGAFLQKYINNTHTHTHTLKNKNTTHTNKKHTPTKTQAPQPPPALKAQTPAAAQHGGPSTVGHLHRHRGRHRVLGPGRSTERTPRPMQGNVFQARGCKARKF